MIKLNELERLSFVVVVVAAAGCTSALTVKDKEVLSASSLVFLGGKRSREKDLMRKVSDFSRAL